MIHSPLLPRAATTAQLRAAALCQYFCRIVCLLGLGIVSFTSFIDTPLQAQSTTGQFANPGLIEIPPGKSLRAPDLRWQAHNTVVAEMPAPTPSSSLSLGPTSVLPEARAHDAASPSLPEEPFARTALGVGGMAPQPSSPIVIRSGDAVWEVNARSLPARTILDPLPKIHFRRANGQRWQETDAVSFVSDCELSISQPNRRTVVYIHGNWTSAEKARQRGLLIYRRLSAMTEEPIQFLIYSWDSDRGSGLAKDVKKKRSRLNAESYYLTQVLRYVPQGNPMGVIGYSFGTGVACGALHLEAGGELSGVQLESRIERPELNVVFLAAAIDRSDLAANRQYSHALDQVDCLDNLYNSSDVALKRFRFLDREHAPIAAGFAGLLGYRQANPTIQLRQFDCTKWVGRSHAELAYLIDCQPFQRCLSRLIGQLLPGGR
ncbi:MAG: hypothetical protein VXZ82_00555 [Planctomycetota bacterium]|nr:hypothetical protein [Planctomycetota bacterium]